MKSIRTSGQRRVLGILGGMGPEATVDLYREVTALTPARRDQDHIPIIIHSNPETPDRTESVREGNHRALPYLIEGVAFLEHAGADFIVIPCNTAHYYIDDLRQGARVPILSIIEEAVRAVGAARPVPACVGILCTDGTRFMNLYGDYLQAAGIPYVYPEAPGQNQVMQLIYGVKSGGVTPQMFDSLRTLVDALKTSGAEAVILGCTELPLLAARGDLGVSVFNPTRLLAAAAVAFSLKG